MKREKLIWFVIPAMLVVVGCETPSSNVSTEGDNIVVSETRVPEPDVHQELCWSNDMFEYKVSDGERSFKCLSSQATLRDLANFAMNDCYNGYLANKIKNKQPITEEDGILLSFILNAQLTTIDTFSVALLGDMTSPGVLHGFIVECQDRSDAFSRDMTNPEILRQQSDAFTELKVKFIDDDTGVRAPMRTWGNGFQAIDQQAIAEVFQDLRKESKTADNSHPWIWSSHLIFCIGPVPKNDIEKACKEYACDSVEGKAQWQAMRETLSVYKKELDALVADMGAYISSTEVADGKSRRIVEDALARTRNDYQGVERYFDYAVYDLPFSLLTYKARAKMKGCQGFWDDDEEKMKEVWTDYANSISDKEMLLNIRTWYSASAYTELIRLFKNEMWEGDFKEFCEQTRLYKINSMGEGKDKNDIGPYYDK